MTHKDDPPRHPGSVVREVVVFGLGLSVGRAAQELKVARQTLYRLLAGQAALTPDMALRIATLSATPPEFWLDLQQKYDLWRTERSLAPLLATIGPRPRPGRSGRRGKDIHA